MALRDAEMHVISLFGSCVLTAAFFVPVLWLANEREVEGPPLREMEAIEATIAYRKTPQKQPQKRTQPQDVAKPEGVSRDEHKKPDKKDEEKSAPKVDPNDPFKGLRRPSDDEGPPTTQPVGDFNGSEKGFAPESKGDPFFGRLRADMNFQFPEIAKATSIPVGCIRIELDGKISDTTFDPPIGHKGDDDLQTAAEAALKELVKVRKATPDPVPTHLLSITTRWLCFKFSVQAP